MIIVLQNKYHDYKMWYNQRSSVGDMSYQAFRKHHAYCLFILLGLLISCWTNDGLYHEEEWPGPHTYHWTSIYINMLTHLRTGYSWCSLCKINHLMNIMLFKYGLQPLNWKSHFSPTRVCREKCDDEIDTISLCLNTRSPPIASTTLNAFICAIILQLCSM